MGSGTGRPYVWMVAGSVAVVTMIPGIDQAAPGQDIRIEIITKQNYSII